ncbi:ORF13 [Bat SARS CoV Rp3/2004]|uniref:Protein 9b n=2 Tax=Severe acute respiratory syndrome coronavirus TaxID=694009 RepID=ORF9B_BCRP3|nr:RecName: Full=Protein 9b; AltName: Full=Accessory protein 9b; AltName: Full=ORF-9b [Bat SARS CoV Rp3/2004]AAZ67047.1 ORF13 [Bat SARS coronavirus Rp2]AAZ67060.1 ORF13 [Bat SARS CoV Rp3/2004]
MDPKTSVVLPALHLVDPQIQLTTTRMEDAVVHGQNNADLKVYPIILRLGSQLSLSMVRRNLDSLEVRVFQSTPIVVKMTKLATTEELPDEFVVVTAK